MLLRIGTTIAGLLATAIPIMFGLRPDLNEEFTHNNATDTSQLAATQGQLQLLHEQMAEQMAALQQQLNELTNRRTIMLMCDKGQLWALVLA